MKKGAVKKKPAVKVGKRPKGLNASGRLKIKRREGLLPKTKKKLDPTKNPLRDFIGIADVEPFAHKIDGELYGK